LLDCGQVLSSRNLGFLLLAGIAGLSQAQAPSASQDDVPLYRTDARLVLLHASVVDKNGKLVTNIPQSAFKVFEDGVEQPIRLFRREDVPVSMGIIVDNSGSMTSKRTRVAAAAMELVKQSNPDDEVFIVNFNDDTHFDQRLTSDVKKLEAALARMQIHRLRQEKRQARQESPGGNHRR
jgi:Ca-activated chloride channel family protein